MSERRSEAQSLEVLAFTRLGAHLQGEWPLAHMPRLADSLLPAEAPSSAAWQLQGEQIAVLGGEPEVWLHLQAQARVSQQCQRCLQAVTIDLDVDRRFRFVRSEAEAAKLDEESEDDVMVLQPRLDAMELLEDELILNLPIVPRHEECPAPLRAAADEQADDLEPAPNPFAALAALRKRKPADEPD